MSHSRVPAYQERQEAHGKDSGLLQRETHALLKLWKAGRGARIRTADLLRPRQARYKAAPRPEWLPKTILPSLTLRVQPVAGAEVAQFAVAAVSGLRNLLNRRVGDHRPPMTRLASALLVMMLGVACGGGGGAGVMPLTSHAAALPAVQVSPASLSFGNQVVGTTSAPQTVTLQDQGTMAFDITGVTTTGDFSKTGNCLAALGPNSSCTFQVRFTPSTTGALAGTLSISTSAAATPQVVSLTGTGTQPVVQLSSPSLTFAAQNTHSTSAAKAVTLTVGGNAPLSISSIAASGDFAETNNCRSSVGEGASCMISVTFTPTTVGTLTGGLTISDDAPGSPQTVSLSGQGFQGLTVTPRQFALTLGQTLQYQVTLVSGVSGAVNWTVDGNPGGNSSVGTISPSGLYTAPASVGQHTIVATLANNSAYFDTAQVYITTLTSGGIFTQRYDNTRVGVNSHETVLTPANVNQNQFGKLLTLPVDGMVYAQPLYMQGVTIPGQGVHNVVFAATEHDSVFAFDADGQSTTPLWSVSFLNAAAGVTTAPWPVLGSSDLNLEVGITSTPVIDPASGTIYVTAKTKEAQDPSCTSNCAYSYFYRLHALDITSGAEKFGGPVVISPSVPGQGYDNVNGTVTFNALRQLQRPGLLLLNGVIYFGFASIDDIDPYHGWLLAYDATNLQQVAVLNITPNGERGGIWQAGGGISVDAAGNMYVVTGNGTFDYNATTNTAGPDYGDSVLKLTMQSGQFQVLDYFTPANQAILAAQDLDLGSDPALVLPDQAGTYPHLLAIAGKDSRLVILNRDNLGQYRANDSGAVQILDGAFTSGLFAGGTYWNGYLYFQASNDYLKQFTLENGAAHLTSTSPAHIGIPNPPPEVSANGTSNAILWLVQTDGYGSGGPAVLHAFDATNVATELYNTGQAPNLRDMAGPAVKFVAPTVANGKVFVAASGEVDVYGLLP